MAGIKINISKVESTLKDMKTTHRNLTNTRDKFSLSVNKIDYTIRQQRSSTGASIGSSISSINNKLNSIDNRLRNIERVIGFATSKYTETENKIIKDSRLFEISIGELTNPNLKGEKPQGDNSGKINDVKDNDVNINKTDVEENGPLSAITAFFKDMFKDFTNDLKDDAVDVTSNMYNDGIDEFVEWARSENFKNLLDPNPNGDKVLIDSGFINDIDGLGKCTSEFFKNFGFFTIGLDYGGLIVEELKKGNNGFKTFTEILVETIPFVLKFTGAAILGFCGVTFGLTGIAAIAATAVSAFALTWVSDKVVDWVFNDNVKDYLKNDFEETINGAINLVRDGSLAIGDAVGIV